MNDGQQLLAEVETPSPHRRSFHGVYDEPDYAALFGEYGAVTVDGAELRYRAGEGGAVSGPGASFGGVAFDAEVVEHPRLEALAETLRQLVAAIREQRPGCPAVTLRLASDEYYPAPFVQSLHAAFALGGWARTGDVTHVVTSDTFRPREMTVRNVKKARRGGAAIGPLSPTVCFDWLSEIKAQKGYRFNYERPRFVRQFETFDEACRCHGVFDPAGTILAAGFEVGTPGWAILVNWDQSPAGRAVSATDFLLAERMGQLFATGRRFVDLGTVTLDGTPNWGLIQHKANFGGYAALRHNYLLALS